jgi:hypothetical protein
MMASSSGAVRSRPAGAAAPASDRAGAAEGLSGRGSRDHPPCRHGADSARHHGSVRAQLRYGCLLLQLDLNRRTAIGLVQNPDDRAMLTALGVMPDHVALIAGSGVDTDRFRPLPEPPITFAFVGRMLDDKACAP